MMPSHPTLPPGCADDAVLESLIEGTLSLDRERALEGHLESCDPCRSRLEAIAVRAEAWSTVREKLTASDFPDDGCIETVSQIPAIATLIQHILAPTDDERMLGRLGPYEIAGIIGSGGMGIVLKGHDRSLDRFVAIKVLAPHLATSGAARQRFLREAKAAAAVVHDNVIAIHGVDEFAGLPYLVMTYCRGTTLERRIRDSGTLTLREILRVGMQTASGLAAAHAQGLIHRDVKPANILLEDGVERVRITDFGLARAADDASLTVTGLLAGTPHYMSPEQALAKPLDARSDLFALGAVLYTMATGKPPFRAESSHAVLRQVTDIEPADVRLANPDLPGWFAGIVSRLLAKAPAARFSSAAEVEEILEACLAHVNAPLATPLPPNVGRETDSPSHPAPPQLQRTDRRTLLGTLRRIMSDQRILSITALMILVAGLLLSAPIAAIAPAGPAEVFAGMALLLSLLLAWLGRADSLGRLVLKLVGGMTVVLGLIVISTEAVRVLRFSNGERTAATFKAQIQEDLRRAREEESAQYKPSVVVPTVKVDTASVPGEPNVTPAMPRDHDPIPDGGSPAGMPSRTAVVASTKGEPTVSSNFNAPSMQGDPPSSAILPPGAQPVFPTSPPPMGMVPPLDPGMTPPASVMAAAPSGGPSTMMSVGDVSGGLGSPFGKMKTDLADSLERLERWLAEHPQEAVAEVTIRRPGALPDHQTMTLDPDADIRPYILTSLEDATNWQQEFTTGFLGRSLAEVFRAGGDAAPPTNAATEVGVQTRLEDGNGFQQEIYVSGDPATGAITTKERRIRFTTDGVFRTLNRTICKDFRDVATGIRLPHRIEIESFDIDPNQPENVIPRKAASVTVVVEEWRPKGPSAPAEAGAVDGTTDAALSAPPSNQPLENPSATDSQREPNASHGGNQRAAVDARTDEDAIQGTWRVHSADEVPRETLETSSLRLRFRGDSMIPEGWGGGPKRYTFRLDSTVTPKHFDLLDGDEVHPGIYSLDDGELWILIDQQTRPRGFNQDTAERCLFVLRRESPANQGAESDRTSVSSPDAAPSNPPAPALADVPAPPAVPDAPEAVVGEPIRQ